MKKEMALVMGLLTGLHCSLAGADTSGLPSETRTQIIPFESYSETNDLPPRLRAVFSVACSQVFERVVRQDRVDPQTGGVTIEVGGLILDRPSMICESRSEISVDAGPVYSGRAFEVEELR